tara:strand:+ start:39018 stop:40301 length:1284 start_codon:yes stop_codon:yes gene_type:complete
MSFKVFGLASAMALSAATAQAQSDPCGDVISAGDAISLEQATRQALAADLRPELAIAGVRAARTERAIAALRPADTVSVEIEDFPGTGLASNIDSLQITGSFSRVWERGGKREAREAFASSGVGVAQAGTAMAAYDIREEVETLYLETAIAEEQIALACDRVRIAQDLEAAVQKRVDAARDPELARATAISDRLRAVADVRRYAAKAENLRAALGAYWQAGADIRIEPDILDTHLIPRPLDVSALYSPELERLNAERLQTAARIELDRKQAIPDVTWSVGVRKFGIEDDLAVIGGASIPLGASIRSDTAVARARAEQRRIEVQRDVLQQDLLRRAIGYQRNAITALDQIEEIDTALLPAATEAVELARDGYARGAFSYLDVIGAQRSVAILREERLAHLRTYILNEAALARLAPPADMPTTRLETPQ